MSYITIRNVNKSYPTDTGSHQVLQNVSLDIDEGEFICLLGPSGCGKTTLLNLTAGFEKADDGQILIDGVPVTKPQKKYITIFQNYGLLPWRTVEKNVLLGLEGEKLSKKEQRERADKYLKLVGLEEYKNYRPGQLSGGMQQRVAIARALCVEPKIIFMDEPFGALDAITRMKLQDDILKISREQKRTVLFVTHDIEEAVFLADRIVILHPNPGRVKRIITVGLGKSRDRTRDDFLEVRDKVMSCFEEKLPDTTEYYI